jgi:hypothetical protein
MSDKSVFLSYRRTDFAWAMALYQDLARHGFDVFLDYEQISSGKFEQVILENIRARTHFLVFLTPGALDGCDSPDDWLRREIEEAIRTERNVIPLLIHGFNFDEPEVVARLSGDLSKLSNYSGVTLSPEYFAASMDKIRKFLARPLDTIAIAPLSKTARDIAERQQQLADSAQLMSGRPLQPRTLAILRWAVAVIATAAVGATGWYAWRPSITDGGRSSTLLPVSTVKTVKIERAAWQPRSCEWSFRGDTGRDLISQGSREILSDGQVPALSDQVNCEIVYGLPLNPPYAVSVTMIALGGGGKGGIIFNEDGGSFYYVELDADSNPTQGKVTVWKNGEWVGSYIDVKMGFNVRTALKMEVRDHETRFYVNDTLVRNDGIAAKAGTFVGLRSAWSAIDFGEFSITLL